MLQPFRDSTELALPVSRVSARLGESPSYRREFRRAFGGDRIDSLRIAQALATYVRTLRSGDAAVDRFRAGDTAALAGEARRGLEIFLGRGRCGVCHTGPTFTDHEFHNTGVAARFGSEDPGRYRVTRRPPDRRAFRTPSLRNVALTAPYMHDGSIATLDEVIEFYAEGGHRDDALDPQMLPIELSESDRSDLLAFLRALTDAGLTGDLHALPSPR